MRDPRAWSTAMDKPERGLGRQRRRGAWHSHVVLGPNTLSPQCPRCLQRDQHSSVLLKTEHTHFKKTIHTFSRPFWSRPKNAMIRCTTLQPEVADRDESMKLDAQDKMQHDKLSIMCLHLIFLLLFLLQFFDNQIFCEKLP